MMVSMFVLISINSVSMINSDNEWVKAVQVVNSCIATLNCGCHVSEDEELYVESLYYRCRQYERVYQDRLARKKKRRETCV